LLCYCHKIAASCVSHFRHSNWAQNLQSFVPHPCGIGAAAEAHRLQLCVMMQDPLLFHRIKMSFTHPDLPWEWDEPEAVCAFLRQFARQAFGIGAAVAGLQGTSSLQGTSLEEASRPGDSHSESSSGGRSSADFERGSSSSSTSNSLIEAEEGCSALRVSQANMMTERGQFGCMKKVSARRRLSADGSSVWDSWVRAAAGASSEFDLSPALGA